MISIKHFALGTPFRYLAMRFTVISSLSVGHMIFLGVSFMLYMMSARTWHMYNSCPTAVLYTARPMSPARPMTRSLASSSRSESTLVWILPDHAHQSRLGCTSDLLTPSIHEPFSRSLCRERRFCRPVSPFVPRSASRFILQKLNLFQNFNLGPSNKPSST